MMFFAIGSPRPVPARRVVKYGSKMWGMCSGSMPMPRSRIEIHGGLQLGQVCHDPRHPRERVGDRGTLLVDERGGFGQAAPQIRLRLRRRPLVDEENREAEREHRQQGAGQENAVGERGSEAHLPQGDYQTFHRFS